MVGEVGASNATGGSLGGGQGGPNLLEGPSVPEDCLLVAHHHNVEIVADHMDDDTGVDPLAILSTLDLQVQDTSPKEELWGL